jgi:hypothetical protein
MNLKQLIKKLKIMLTNLKNPSELNINEKKNIILFVFFI